MKIKSSKVLKSLIAVILAALMIVGTTATGFAVNTNISKTGEPSASSFQIRGDGNDMTWSSGPQCNSSGDAYVYCSANGSFHFKLYTSDRSAWAGLNATIEDSCSGYKFYHKDSTNCTFKSTKEGYYKFHVHNIYWDNDNPNVELDISYVTDYNRVWLYNSDNWTSQYIHFWGGGCATSWPGKQMKQYCTNSPFYYFDIPTTENLCIYNNNAGIQTSDTSISNNMVFKNGNSGGLKGSAYEVEVSSGGNGSVSINTNDKIGSKYLLATSSDVKSYTITATPNSGYKFDHWEHTGSITLPSSSSGAISLSSAGTVTAYFVKDVPMYNVNISAGTGGSVSPSGDQQVDETTGISVTATANTGYHFKEWSVTGGATVSGSTTSGKTTTATVKATAEGAVQAIFAIDTFNTTAEAWYTDNGTSFTKISSSSPASVSPTTVNYNSSATFTAGAKTGYSFVGWYTGTKSSSIGSLENSSSSYEKKNITKDITLCAVYKKNYTVTLKKLPDNVSSVKINNISVGSKDEDKNYTYLAGDNLTFSATFATNYSLDHWTINDEEKLDASPSINKISDNYEVSITPVLTIKKWAIYGDNTMPEITGWNKAGAKFFNDSGKIAINLPASTSYSADGSKGFKIVSENAATYWGYGYGDYNLLIDKTCTLTLEKKETSGSYRDARNMGIKSTHAGTYIFELTNISGTPKLSVYYPGKVTFNKNGHGIAPNAQVVTYNEKATKPTDLTEEGYTFLGWFTKQNPSSTDTPFDFDTPITGDITLYAKWIENKAQVTVNKNSDTDITLQLGSTSKTNEISGLIGSQTTTTLKATVPTGYKFVRWDVSALTNYGVTIGDVNSANTTIKFSQTLNSDESTDTESKATITAVVTRKSFTVQAKAYSTDDGSAKTENPDIQVSVSTPEVLYQNEAIFTATEFDGYTFCGWYDKNTFTGNPVSTSLVYTYTQDSPTDGKTLYAYYKKNYIISIDTFDATKINKVTISANSGTAQDINEAQKLTYLAGDSLSITSIQNSGYVFAFWTSDDEDYTGANNVNGSFTYVVTKDIKFQPNAIVDPIDSTKQIVWLYNYYSAQTWATTPYCYIWDDAGERNHDWPGEQMTQLSDVDGKLTNYWFYICDKKYDEGIIFNNGSDAKQTKNLTYSKSGDVFTITSKGSEKEYNGSWKSGTTSLPIKVKLSLATDAETVAANASVTPSSSNIYVLPKDATINGTLYKAGLNIKTTANNTGYHFASKGWNINENDKGVFVNQTSASTKFVPISAQNLSNGITLTAAWEQNISYEIVSEETEGVTSYSPSSALSGASTTVTYTLSSGYYLFESAVYKVDEDGNLGDKITSTTNVTNNKITFKMPDCDVKIVPEVDKMYSASYIVYTNRANNSEGGKVTISNETRKINSVPYFKKGTAVKYTASVSDYYSFVGWYPSTDTTFQGEPLSTETTYSVTMGESNISVIAHFARITYIAGPAIDKNGDFNTSWSKNFAVMNYNPKNNRYFYYINNPKAGQEKDGKNDHATFNFYSKDSSTDTDKMYVFTESHDGTEDTYYGAGVKCWKPANNTTANNLCLKELETADYEVPVKIELLPCKGNDHSQEKSTGTPECFKISGLEATRKTNSKIVLSDGHILADFSYSSTTKFVSKDVPTGADITIANTSQVGRNSETYRIGNVVSGKTNYEIKTTISGDDKDYLKVEAFVVYDQGTKKSYSLEAQPGENNSYRATLTNVTASCYVCPVIVHNDKYYKENAGSSYTKVYVDPKEIPSGWGGLIGIYTWDTNSKDSHGEFPGQLLIPTNDGMYYTYIESLSSTSKFNGATFTNYYQDTAIKTESSIFSNYSSLGSVQTYDYLEPRSLFAGGYTNLTFEFQKGDIQYHGSSSTYSKDTNKRVSSNKEITSSSNNIKSDYFGSNNNWKYLTARDGESLVDLGNNKLVGSDGNFITTETVESNADCYYVVCKGDTDTKNYQAKDGTYNGEFSVQWYIFDSNGAYVTNKLSASIFDGKNVNDTSATSALEDALKSTPGYKGKPVKVCYEAYNAKDYGNIRYSGQWTGTNNQEKVRAEIIVGTTTSTTSETLAANTCTINTAGESGYQADNINTIYGSAFVAPNDGSKIENQSCEVLLSSGDIALASTSANTDEYYLVGFYLKNADGNYEQIVGGDSGSFLISKNTKIYAFFKHINESQIVINNAIYNNKDESMGDISNDGHALTSIALYNYSDSADHHIGTIVASDNEKQDGTASITPTITRGNKYVIQITTKSLNKGTFNKWYCVNSEGKYEGSLFGSTDPIGEETTSNAYIEITIPSTGTFTKNYTYYSDVKPKSRKAEMTYIYKDRFNVTKRYVVTYNMSEAECNGYSGNENSPFYPTYKWTQEWRKDGETKYTSADEIKDIPSPGSGYTPIGNAFNMVKDLAPRQSQSSVYGQDIEWKITKNQFTKDTSKITLVATQVAKTYTISCTYKDPSGAEQVEVYTNCKYNQQIEFTKEMQEGFKYWATKDKNGNYIYVTSNQNLQIAVFGDNTDAKEYYAVYEGGIDTWTPYISDIVKTRQITTSSDNCFVDFMLTMSDGSGKYVKNDKSVTKYGIIYVMNKSVNFDYNDYQEHKSDDSYWQYPSKNQDQYLGSTLTSAVLNMTGSLSYYDDDSNRRFLIYDYSATAPSMYNRLDCVSSAMKSSSYGKKSYTAYAYMVVNGQVVINDSGYDFYLADQLNNQGN